MPDDSHVPAAADHGAVGELSSLAWFGGPLDPPARADRWRWLAADELRDGLIGSAVGLAVTLIARWAFDPTFRF